MKYLFFAILALLLTALSSGAGECVSGDCQNGRGAMTFPNGEKYVGEWKENVVEGQGTYTWPNGQKYEGKFENGVVKGQGTHTWLDGQRYVGEWKEGKKNGQGTRTFPDGKKYAEVWEMGKRVSYTEITHQQKSEVKSNQSSVSPPSGHRWKKPVK
ncbi:MORN repeat-containing protein [Desulfopila sp. IMCC35008]|uniref:MORN repeat-containing protein n=1 Tax=Desulfopila sp. IMCC35008 TaxID=2653858 RepID=UPI0013D65ECA|nr:hypothetical protein [Desulfopila sp. IMCC35008]